MNVTGGFNELRVAFNRSLSAASQGELSVCMYVCVFILMLFLAVATWLQKADNLPQIFNNSRKKKLALKESPE